MVTHIYIYIYYIDLSKTNIYEIGVQLQNKPAK